MNKTYRVIRKTLQQICAVASELSRTCCGNRTLTIAACALLGLTMTTGNAADEIITDFNREGGFDEFPGYRVSSGGRTDYIGSFNLNYTFGELPPLSSPSALFYVNGGGS